MITFSIFVNNKYKNVLLFAVLLWCTSIVAAQNLSEREVNLRSLVAAEQNFSRVSAEKGTREAFLAFLADDGVIFNPFPANGKQIWMPREKAPGILTWTPVFADVSAAGDLGLTTGPYEFRRAAGESAVGYGYYTSVWRKGADGAWRVLLDIGTRNQPPESTPALEFPQIKQSKAKKKIDLERTRAAFKTADDDLSRLLSEEKPASALSDYVNVFLRVHLMNEFPVTERNAALAALYKYQGKINSKTNSSGVARSGDFAYSYGTYAAKETSDSDKSKFNETGSFARIWRRDEKGEWKLTLVVMHAAPPDKRFAQ